MRLIRTDFLLNAAHQFLPCCYKLVEIIVMMKQKLFRLSICNCNYCYNPKLYITTAVHYGIKLIFILPKRMSCLFNSITLIFHLMIAASRNDEQVCSLIEKILHCSSSYAVQHQAQLTDPLNVWLLCRRLFCTSSDRFSITSIIHPLQFNVVRLYLLQQYGNVV
ncbi:hypothetical protein D917_04234 [Trichinella nativa]|uniref:Uncharacterized protein n=1 Tax=Trichinella nativa TaxID=6335 RepID=A0A1Y3E8S9_9BILA|nr:hypothetical protein D917_04234 [Trichinella nativa]